MLQRLQYYFVTLLSFAHLKWGKPMKLRLKLVMFCMSLLYANLRPLRGNFDSKSNMEKLARRSLWQKGIFYTLKTAELDPSNDKRNANEKVYDDVVNKATQTESLSEDKNKLVFDLTFFFHPEDQLQSSWKW